MTLFSLNLNKIALLRNSRGADNPNLVSFATRAISTGVKSLTIHPRLDERHIKFDDILSLSNIESVRNNEVELNIEGDLRSDLIDLVRNVRPAQFTVVPVAPNEITSNRGWAKGDDNKKLAELCHQISDVRVAVFCDPCESSFNYAIDAGVNAIELFTGPYAYEYYSGTHQKELENIVVASEKIKNAGLRLNGGHDLTLSNLPSLMRSVEFDEFSIGHQVVVDSLSLGWEGAVTKYLDVISKESTK